MRPRPPPGAPRHWQALAERADQEGWPAARFLAALAEIELAERDTRRIRRHLLEANLPAGKTLATFDFKAMEGWSTVIDILLSLSMMLTSRYKG